MSAAKPPRRFKERTIRTGWVGEPVVGDRLLRARRVDFEVTFTPAERIARIDYLDGNVRYQLANGTAVLAMSGTHLTWEEP